MAHVRSDFTVRVRRSALPPVPAHVQTAALLVRGVTASGRFHIQVTASTHAAGSDELLFRMIPDLDILSAQLANQDPELDHDHVSRHRRDARRQDDRHSQRDDELDQPQSL